MGYRLDTKGHFLDKQRDVRGLTGRVNFESVSGSITMVILTKFVEKHSMMITSEISMLSLSGKGFSIEPLGSDKLF